ncbi:endonuclease/exonuclease/phosphatase family protein, partial [candidate division WOR-3 bacterium]|nr:endonuclease/exonuclease/phosphatase family protein [candidate division WOR-3 bacterium]
MLLLSWNINGIRAAVKRGFLSWLESCGADAVCLQEVKARPDQVPAQVRQPEGWHVAWNPAERPGYSGVVTLQRERPG